MQSDICLITANDMQFTWNEILDPNVRIIHFVREPFDMVVSGYLYHSQSPPPESEGWLQDMDFDPCAINEQKVFNDYSSTIGTFLGDTDKFRDQVRAAVSLCKQLRDKYGGGKFNSLLRFSARNGEDPNDEFDGFRLEALRALLSNRGGDILRMGANAVYESQGRRSKRMFLSAFPMGDKDAYRASIAEAYRYLMGMGYKENKEKGFWDCLDFDAIVDAAMEESYRDDGKQGA
jgi:hypothetical protein